MLAPLVDRVAREVLRRESLPAPILWALASDGMTAWFRWLDRGLRDHLGGKEETRRILSDCIAPAFERRYRALRSLNAHLPDPSDDPRASVLLMRALYPAPSARKIAWVLPGPKSAREVLRAYRLLAPLDFRTRWIEVATHLGEVLIALTERLPLRGASGILGDICFEAGVRYAARARDRWRLPQSPASAIEVLRVGEYLFRVNPEHESAHDDAAYTGMIEGSACPWYMRPGWQRMHCGIFGQFQAGVSSVFDLKYKLTKTIPRHGGDSCRVELVPIGRRSTALTEADRASPRAASRR